jgi:Tol biopolymer transport system component
VGSSCSDTSGPNGAPALTNSIVFVSDLTGEYQLYSMNIDGTNVQRLTDIPGLKRDPAVSPDGRTIVFAVSTNPYDQKATLYSVRSDGTHLTQLTHSTAVFDVNPSWTPDGRRISFSRSLGDTTSVYEMRANGTDVANRVHHHGVDYQPVWRPGGSTFLFMSDRDHLGGINGELYSSDATGLSIHAVVEGFDAAWSPTGDKFVFKRDGQLWISDSSDGSSVRQLTSFLSSFYQPSWSPDGQKIFFASSAGPYEAIYWVDAANGAGPYQLTDSNYGDCSSLTLTKH